MSLRPDLAAIAAVVPQGARVLDLGCGSGELLAHLQQHKGCTGYGIEIADANVHACVQRGVNGVYTARFGYNNTTGSAVTIYMGGDNYITPGNQYQGQPIVFQPGRVVSAFSISFARIDSDTLGSWYLKGPDNVVRQVNALTSSPSCP